MFFFPLKDDNDTNGQPVVMWTILIACILTFMWQVSMGREEREMVIALGMIPARIFGILEFPNELAYTPAWMTIISSMFLHGGFMHLAGNMLYLWIFADNVEDSMGPVRFIILYVLCGIAAAFSQAMMDPQSTVPMIGASGAIAGTLGAYLMLHPRANVRCVAGIFVFFKRFNIPAFIVLGGWIGLQFLNLGQSDSNVAYVAHIGGFVAGMALIPFLKRGDVPLFAPAQSKAFEVTPLRQKTIHVPQVPSKMPPRDGQAGSVRPQKHPWEN
ncbi:rhomboid family intramembrane serine protease [Alphaproteobacteria bacterium]|jgi:membrane associated rhomboid family serine protease|nr:rhomboid family intramembrane serine protease [Alphaproteobacteria bacterium]